jgi:hypothetical protein
MGYQVLRKHRALPLIAVVFLVGGCAIGGVGGPPQNAEDLRVLVRLSPFKSVETFEVARSFQDVTSTLRKKDKECLAVIVNWQCTNCIFKTTGTITFKTTLVTNANRTELHFQRKGGSGGHEIGAPPDGPYRIVLDAFPAGSNRTKIDLYVRSIDDNRLRDAFRGWVQGTNLGCPDMTRR